VLARLAEAEAGSTTMRSLATPAASSARARSERNAATSPTTSPYEGSTCMVSGVPCMCITQTHGYRRGDGLDRPGSAKGVHVVHHRRARRDRAAHHLGLHRVHETTMPASASASIDGKHAPQLFVERNGRGAGTRRLAAHVHEVGASSRQAPAVIDRAGRIEEAPPSEKESAVTFTMPMTACLSWDEV
jgi:hypothetical protein